MELLRTLKSGIEILKGRDSYGELQYIAVDPKGYIGRTQTQVNVLLLICL